jgi:membrane associated rhomboid family serine protease
MLKSLPPATRAILVANVIVFLLVNLYGAFGVGSLAFLNSLALWPLQTPWFEPWQVITYSFVHEQFLHLFFNMFGLWMFGRTLEAEWGARNFLVYYFASVLAAAGTQLLWTTATGQLVPTVGASGGVFGVLLAFAVLYPRQRLMMIFPPIPMPAWLFVTLYGIFELVLGVTGSQAGVAHFAHLGGMVGGALVFAFWRTPRPLKRR